jgi:hypothetical protein
MWSPYLGSTRYDCIHHPQTSNHRPELKREKPSAGSWKWRSTIPDQAKQEAKEKPPLCLKIAHLNNSDI